MHLTQWVKAYTRLKLDDAVRLLFISAAAHKSGCTTGIHLYDMTTNSLKMHLSRKHQINSLES